MPPRLWFSVVLSVTLTVAIVPRSLAQEQHEIDLAALDAGITVTLPATEKVTSVRIVNLVPGRAYVLSHPAGQTEIKTTFPTSPDDSDAAGCCQRGKMIAPKLCSAADPSCTEERIASLMRRIQQAAHGCGNTCEFQGEALDATTRMVNVGGTETGTTITIQAHRKWTVAFSPCHPEARLFHFMLGNFPHRSLTVLAFDHDDQDWLGYSWDGRRLLNVGGTDIIEDDLNGTPTLKLAREADAAVVVMNTNPMVYGVVDLAVTKETREELADFQALAQLVSTFVPAVARIVAPDFNLSLVNKTHSLAHSTLLRVTADPEPSELLRAAAELSSRLADSADAMQKKIAVFITAGKRVETAVFEVERRSADMMSFIQQVELGQAPPSTEVSEPLLLGTDAAFRDLQAAVHRDGVVPICPERLASLQALLVPHLKPPDKNALIDAERAYAKQLVQASGTMEAGSCGAAEGGMRLILAWLKAHRLGPTPKITAAEKASLLELDGALTAYGDLAKDFQSRVTAAGQVIAKRSTAAKTAASHDLLRKRLKNVTGADDAKCSVANSVFLVELIEGDRLPLDWAGRRSSTLKVVADSGLATNLVLDRPASVNTGYKVVRPLHWDLEIDPGVVYTRLAAPEWGVRAIEGEEKKFHVVRKDQKTRAGELALFLTARRWILSPQIGFGLNPEHPSAFVGFSSGWRFLRLSSGWTWQQVTELREQKENETIVTTADQIQTRDAFEDDWYLAISININDLPFFVKKE